MKSAGELPFEDEHIFSVTEINEAAREVMEGAFPSVRVQGEISGYKKYPSGHHYFDLKDEGSRVSCALFAGRAARGLRITLENGALVICTGNLSIYARDGRYQLIVSSVEAAGLGALWLKLEALKKKLQDEGLLDEGRKKPLPAYPRKVGIVTSPEGQAVHDILKTLKKRAPQIAVLIYPVRVQGEGAAVEIADGLRWMDAHGGCDLIVTGRGGGSIEDLWAFNEEVVARAIAACRTPVISAVGHEKDVLLSDLVADARAPTPTGAAEMLSKSREEILESIARLRQQMKGRVTAKIGACREQVSLLRMRPGFRRVESGLYQLMQRVDAARAAAVELMRRRIERGRALASSTRVRLERCNPAVLLQRRRERVGSLSAQLSMLLARGIELRGHSLRNLASLLRARQPLPAIAAHRRHVRDVADALARVVAAGLHLRRDQLGRSLSVLWAMGPYQVLERGYSICFKEDGVTVISDFDSVRESENIRIRLRRGRLGAEVRTRGES